jgi:glutamate racemase
VAIIDPAAAVAREVRRRLEQAGLLNDEVRSGTTRFWTSGSPAQLERMLRTLDIEPGEVTELAYD